MKNSLKTGLTFGLTSGIITTLGLMVGLDSGTHSRIAVLGGILTIAIADAFSDALGVHISKESEEKTEKEVWESTAATFLSKFVFAMTFVVPVVMFDLSTAIAVSVVWGMSLLSILSYFMARQEGEKPWKVVSEHIAIALLVIVITHYVGDWIGSTFSSAI